MHIEFIGHAAFHITDGDHRVLIDPFITGNPAAIASADDFDPQTILLTHAHNDHVGDTIAIATKSNATVIAVVELADYLEMNGVENVIATNHGGTVAFSGGTVKFVPAWHSSAFTTADGVVAPGVPAGLVVRFGGQTIYFAGDTALFSDMSLIADEGLGIAVLPIGDLFTMGPDDAVKAAALLRAETVIPCHYNTFPAIEQDAAAFKRSIAAATSSTVAVMRPGDTLEF